MNVTESPKDEGFSDDWSVVVVSNATAGTRLAENSEVSPTVIPPVEVLTTVAVELTTSPAGTRAIGTLVKAA